MFSKRYTFLVLFIIGILGKENYKYKTTNVSSRGKAKMPNISKGLAYAKKYYNNVLKICILTSLISDFIFFHFLTILSFFFFESCSSFYSNNTLIFINYPAKSRLPTERSIFTFTVRVFRHGSLWLYFYWW